MLDNLFNEIRHTTTAEEQNKIDGTPVQPCQKQTKEPIDIRTELINKVGFTGKKKSDYELIKKKR